MTLLDYYTAGTVEYFTLLFTTFFGVLGLYLLVRDPSYRRHLNLLTSVYVFLSSVTGWVVARLIGTTVLIYLELQAGGYWDTYSSQAATYDPLGITRFVPWVVSTPFYYVFYLGVPLIVVLVMLWMWRQLVWKEIRKS